MFEKCKDLFWKYKEAVMYLIMGVITTVVNWVTYAVFIRVFDNLKDKVFISNLIAWIISVTFAYITNKILVFKSKNWEFKFVIKEVFLFVSARIGTGLFEIFGVPFLAYTLGFDAKLFGIEAGGAKVVVSVFVVIANYVFSKIFIFKSDKTKE